MAIDSETSVYNLALSSIGARSNISSPNENSREAEVCRLWYDVVRDQVLGAARWPEATKFVYLALLSSQDDGEWVSSEPFPGFSYAYKTPVDMLRPQYLADFSKFRVTNNADGSVILNTDAAKAVLAYTFRSKLVTQWSPGLQMAIMYALAANICLPLTGKTQRANLMLGKANDIIIKAREASANWSNESYESVPEWLQARGYGMSQYDRFFYPLGDLLSVAA